MALLTTRDGAAVEPGTPLYWLEPGTTRVYEAETWTRDAAMQRWSSPVAALEAALDVAKKLRAVANNDIFEAHERHDKHLEFERDCRLAMNAKSLSPARVPPTDRPEAG